MTDLQQPSPSTTGSRIASALLVANQRAATGHSASAIAPLQRVLVDRFGSTSTVQLANGHASVTRAVFDFLQNSPRPSLVIAGGGGGTLRAVIEAVRAVAPSGSLPGADRVRLAALRLGSGNVFAKRLGVPLDPVVALTSIAERASRGHLVQCCVMRFETGMPGQSVVYHGATLAGLGQFGTRAGRSCPVARAAAARSQSRCKAAWHRTADDGRVRLCNGGSVAVVCHAALDHGTDRNPQRKAARGPAAVGGNSAEFPTSRAAFRTGNQHRGQCDHPAHVGGSRPYWRAPVLAVVHAATHVQLCDFLFAKENVSKS